MKSFFALAQDEIIATHLFDYLGTEDTKKPVLSSLKSARALIQVLFSFFKLEESRWRSA